MKLGVTQKEIAEKAEMTLSYYQKLEYGSRSVDKLSLEVAVKLADALKVDIRELIS